MIVLSITHTLAHICSLQRCEWVNPSRPLPVGQVRATTITTTTRHYYYYKSLPLLTMYFVYVFAFLSLSLSLCMCASERLYDIIDSVAKIESIFRTPVTLEKVTRSFNSLLLLLLLCMYYVSITAGIDSIL